MFGRKKPLSPLTRAAEFVWPRRGFTRGWGYLWRRVQRIKGSPHAIAAGVAAGAAVSFLPFIGLHFVLAVLSALILRGSMIAAMIGTVVGNPWTFPFIWIATYRLGRWLDIGEGKAIAEGSIGARLKAAFDALWEGSFELALKDGWSVLAPMLAGGLIIGALVGGLLYLLVRKAAATYQASRKARIEAGRARWRQAAAKPANEEA